MNRKEFLLKSIGLGAAGAGAFTIIGGPCCAQQPQQAQGTPCNEKYGFSQTWVKRFMDILDADVDEPTRLQLMRTMGRTCYVGAHGKRGNRQPEPGDLDKLLAGMKKYGGDEMIRREGDVIHFQYIRNPAGLRVADGWCLCPLVEKGPEGLSGTFCACSEGYVTEMFERASEVPVKVELVESLKRGGKTCMFRIQLLPQKA
jgi:predicted hydrocarbon binding protein